MLSRDDLNKVIPEITNDKRRAVIIDFLRNNPGCNKESVVRGVINISSKKTTLKILDELETEKIITIEKDKPNSKAYKIFLHNKHILIVLDKQIKDINEEFKKLVQKIEAIIPELILLPFTNKDNIDKNFIMIILYEQLPLFILKYLMQCLLLKSIVVWPKTIQEEQTRNKLNSLILTEISKIFSDYSTFYNSKLSKSNIHKVNYNPKIPEELTKIENNILFFASFLRLCEKKGIAKEFENVVDKIWIINSDVQEYIHPEARRYNLDYDYGKDDWRKYLNLYKQHINRIEEFENVKKQKLSNFTSDLNVRDFF